MERFVPTSRIIERRSLSSIPRYGDTASRCTAFPPSRPDSCFQVPWPIMYKLEVFSEIRCTVYWSPRSILCSIGLLHPRIYTAFSLESLRLFPISPPFLNPLYSLYTASKTAPPPSFGPYDSRYCLVSDSLCLFNDVLSTTAPTFVS